MYQNKFKQTVILLAAAACGVSFAVPSTQSQIDQLQKQLEDLKKQVEETKSQPNSISGSVGVGPLYGYGDSYGGWDLLVNAPSINRDWSLVKRQSETDHYLNITDPAREYLRVSGDIDNTVIRNQPADNQIEPPINNTWGLGGHLDFSASTSDWVNLFTELKFASDAPSEDKLSINNAFVVLGNFDKTPFYVSAGKMYVPFGNYATYFWNDPLTKQMGRVKEKAANVGYSRNGWIASAYIGDSELKINPQATNIQNTGLSIRKMGGWTSESNHHFGYNFGAGYINQFGNADHVYATWAPTDNIVHHQIPGIAFDAKLTVDSFDLISEYVGAAKRFESVDLAVSDQKPTIGAKPQSYRFEGAYRYHYKEHSGVMSIAYDRTLQSALFTDNLKIPAVTGPTYSAFPRYRYGAALSYSPFRRVVTTLEFLRQANYSVKDGGVGGFSNLYTFDVDCFF